MTLEYLQFHAVERPEVLAFADGTREVSFAAMLKDFAKVAAALRMLGIATASFQRNEGAACLGQGTVT